MIYFSDLFTSIKRKGTRNIRLVIKIFLIINVVLSRVISVLLIVTIMIFFSSSTSVSCTDKLCSFFFVGTFARRQGAVYMDLSFTNRAMQAMGGFAIQFNKNSFGIAPTALQVQSPLSPNTTAQTSLLVTPGSKFILV